MVACVSAIVLSQDVVEHSSNLRLRSKDCLLEVHQLVPYCSGFFNFDVDINATLIYIHTYIKLFKEGTYNSIAFSILNESAYLGTFSMLNKSAYLLCHCHLLYTIIRALVTLVKVL